MRTSSSTRILDEPLVGVRARKRDSKCALGNAERLETVERVGGADDAALPFEQVVCFFERELGFPVLARGDQDVRESAPCLTRVVGGGRAPHDGDGLAGK